MDFYTSTEASAKLGVSTKTIRKYVKDKKLSGEVIRGSLRITAESVRNFHQAFGGRKEENKRTVLKNQVTVDLEHYEGLITRKTQLEAQYLEWQRKEQTLLEYKNTNKELTNNKKEMEEKLRIQDEKLRKAEQLLEKEQAKSITRKLFEKLAKL